MFNQTEEININNNLLTMVEITDEDVRYFIRKVKQSSGYDLHDYSPKSLKRRIEKLLTEYNTDIHCFFEKYDSTEINYSKLINDITVNTTELFRDNDIWKDIRYKVLAKTTELEEINIWHAGCSTGQEVYSMLILLHELGIAEKTNIIATDINSEVLYKAQKGEYKYRFNLSYLDSFNEIINKNPYNYDVDRGVPFDRYLNLNKTKDTIQMKSFLRDKPVFSIHDLVKEKSPRSFKFDIILCRNVLIYFNFKLQNRIFELFHENLKMGGSLIIGKHESLPIPFLDKFNRKNQFYEKSHRRN